MTHSGSLHRVNPHCPLKEYSTVSQCVVMMTHPKTTHLQISLSYSLAETPAGLSFKQLHKYTAKDSRARGSL